MQLQAFRWYAVSGISRYDNLEINVTIPRRILGNSSTELVSRLEINGYEISDTA